jgi:hypothetical protein
MSPVNGSVAPSCPISRSQPTQMPRNLPDIAAIPPVRDLRSVITAINAMNNIVQHLTRGAPQINNIRFAPIPGQPDPVPDPPPQYERTTWVEVDRDYADNKVVNPDDSEQYVEIKTLSYIKWRDETTGHWLVYRGQ